MKSRGGVAFFVVLAIFLFVVAALYAIGTINFLTTGTRHHYTHAALFAGLGLVSLVAASFSRPRAAY